MLVLIDKTSNKVELYSSVKTMFECRSDILKIGIQHFYNLNSDEWENKLCRVVKCDVIKKLVPTLQDELKMIEDQHQLIKVSENINLVIGNYVKKADFYYFNFDGHIYKGSANLEFWTFGLTRLKNSKKILGEIKDIIFS